MNARQKAEHYKKLYEQAKIPVHTVCYTSSNLDHLVANSRIDLDPDIMEHISEKELLRMHISRIADQLEKDVIPNHIDIFEDKGIASFDFWVRRNNENKYIRD